MSLFNFFKKKKDEEVTGPVLETIPNGRLYIINQNNQSKVKRKCLFLEAQASVLTTDIKHQYQLVISNLVSDDDTPPDLEDLERTFLIDESIRFSLYNTQDEGDDESAEVMGLSWIDVSSTGSGECFEFLVDPQNSDVSVEKVKKFVEVVEKSMFERAYQKSSWEVPQEEIEAYKNQLKAINALEGAPASPRSLRYSERSDTPERERSITPQAEYEEDGAEEAVVEEEDREESAQEEEGDESDSSADEIANQLRATNLNSSPKSTPASSKILSSRASPSVTKGKSPVKRSSPEKSPAPGSRASTSQTKPSVLTERSAKSPSSLGHSAVATTPASLGKYQGKGKSPVSSRLVQNPSPAPSPSLGKKIIYNKDRERSTAPASKADLGSTTSLSPTTPSNSESEVLTNDHPVCSIAPISDATSASITSPPSPKLDTQPASPHPSSSNQAQNQLFSDSVGQPSPETAQHAWSDHCDLYFFDEEAGGFKLQKRGVLAVLWIPTAGCTQTDFCWLTVLNEDDGMNWLCMNIDSNQAMKFEEGFISFKYTRRNPETGQTLEHSWLLRFLDQEGQNDLTRYHRAQEAFTAAIFNQTAAAGGNDESEPTNSSSTQSAARAPAPEIQDIEIPDAEPGSETESGSESESEESDSENDSDKQGTRNVRNQQALPVKRKSTNGPQNSQLAVGYKEDMSFVVRGDMIGIFQNEKTRGQQLKFMASIAGLTTPDGRKLVPSKVMLHKQDTLMILQDPINKNSLYSLDLGVGKVVEEWKMGMKDDISNFFPRTKFSQMNPESTLLGHSEHSLFAIDPRLSGSKLATEKEWKTVSYTSGTTTQQGFIVLGCRKGDIKLLDSKIGKNATVSLQGYGEDIIGVDVSSDGRWVIATCKTFLMLYDCEHKSGSDRGTLGYAKKFSMAEKPGGFRIELKPHHRAMVAKEGIEIKFTPAKFNQGPDSIEKSIVTHIGPYIFDFNFRKLKNHEVYYTAKRYDEQIVDGAFKWNNSRDIVVTMPGDVFLENRKSLFKPDRNSLVATPLRSGRNSNHNNGVVREWDG